MEHCEKGKFMLAGLCADQSCGVAAGGWMNSQGKAMTFPGIIAVGASTVETGIAWEGRLSGEWNALA